MKNKKFFLVAAFTALLGVATLGGVVNNTELTSASAATTTWSLAGTMNGWNTADTTYDMTHTSTDGSGNYVYEITVTFAKDVSFKIVKNHSWGTSVGWNDYSTDQGKGDYLTKDGENFKVKAAGDYVITFVDKSVTNPSYGPWAGDVAIAIAESVTKYTVTYHLDTPVTEEYSENEVWNSKFVEKEGYRLEGWYTEESLTNKFVKGTKVTTDLDLYPNYVEAEDYTIYLLDEKGLLGETEANIYMWCDAFDGHNNQSWPGAAITGSNGFFEIEIDASKTYDYFIINNGEDQTINIPLSTTTKLYRLSSTTDGEGHYTGSIHNMDAAFLAEFIMESDTEGQCETKFEDARNIYLALPATEQEAFLTHAEAKERFEAWGVSLGQDPYSRASAARGMLFNTNDNNTALIVILAVSLVAVAAYFTIRATRKSRKEN